MVMDITALFWTALAALIFLVGVWGGQLVHNHLSLDQGGTLPWSIQIGDIICAPSRGEDDYFKFPVGQELAQADYPDLFIRYGNRYGAAAPGNFRLPDLRGRTPYCLDNLGGTPANRVTNPQADIDGGVLGSEFHTLTESQTPIVAHSITDNGHWHTQQTGIDTGGGAFSVIQTNGSGNALSTLGVPTTTAQTGVSIANHGGGQPHNNMPPAIFFPFLVRVK